MTSTDSCGSEHPPTVPLPVTEPTQSAVMLLWQGVCSYSAVTRGRESGLMGLAFEETDDEWMPFDMFFVNDDSDKAMKYCAILKESEDQNIVKEQSLSDSIHVRIPLLVDQIVSKLVVSLVYFLLLAVFHYEPSL